LCIISCARFSSLSLEVDSPLNSAAPPRRRRRRRETMAMLSLSPSLPLALPLPSPHITICEERRRFFQAVAIHKLNLKAKA
jgi:hypothetical protein